MLKKILLLMCCITLICLAARAETPCFTMQEITGCEMTSSAYELFYQSGTPCVLIPGLKENLVPQGLCRLDEKGWLVFTGYSGVKGSSSAMIAVDENTGEIVRQVLLKNTDGSPYTGHAGGICFACGNFYISNAGKLYRVSLERFLQAKGSCVFEEEIAVPVNSSYCCAADGMICVGEFQYEQKYKTDASHKLKTADGIYKAWTCCYCLNGDGSFPLPEEGQSFAAPSFILSTPEKIQGITIYNGSIYLSQSYGRRNSSLIMRFDGVFSRAEDSSVDFAGQSIPVWFLDSTHRSACLMAPPMSEALCSGGGGVYVLFESAASLYRQESDPSVNPMDRVFYLSGF